MDLEATTVEDFHNQLIEVCVMFQEVELMLGEIHVVLTFVFMLIVVDILI